MSKHWKPGRQTVALQPAPRPSRIRRDPLLVKPIEKKVAPPSREQEIWLGVTGILLFALAIAVATMGDLFEVVLLLNADFAQLIFEVIEL